MVHLHVPPNQPVAAGPKLITAVRIHRKQRKQGRVATLWRRDTHTQEHTHTHAHIYIHICIHAHKHMYMHTHAHTCTHIDIHMHTRTHTHTCTDTHIHTYTHIDTHTHTHTDTHVRTLHTCTQTQKQIDTFKYCFLACLHFVWVSNISYSYPKLCFELRHT